MPKVYSITLYRAEPDPARHAAYVPLASAALAAAGGRFISRGRAVRTYEAGLMERSVVIEWDSVEQFVAFYEGEAYQAALAELGDVERDVRVVEGV
jgi:uncharacterized protein (DUF1330 family)